MPRKLRKTMIIIGGGAFGILYYAEIKIFTQGLPDQIERDMLTDTAIIK